MKKTNAMRALESLKIPYETLVYSADDGHIDGIAVADKVGKPYEVVFKTLVTVGLSGALYVMIIPVADALDLKKAARVAGEKSLTMLAVKDITKHTGYIRGGCSPLAMKKQYGTFIHGSAEVLEQMVVSAGVIGQQIVLKPADLLRASKGHFADLTIDQE